MEARGWADETTDAHEEWGVLMVKMELKLGTSDVIVPTEFQFRDDFEGHNLTPITFTRMRSPFYHGERWGVRRIGWCLTTAGEWEYEPSPSSRDEAFYNRARFGTLEAAVAAAVANVERNKNERVP